MAIGQDVRRTQPLTPEPERPAPRGAFSTRSPWFWLLAGLGPLALGLLVLAGLTALGWGPVSLPAKPDRPQIGNPSGLRPALTPEQEKERVRRRLDAVQTQLRQLTEHDGRLRQALGRAERAAVTADQGEEARLFRAILADTDVRRKLLVEEATELTARLRALSDEPEE